MALNSRTASPWWASLVFLFGLLVVFVGERFVAATTGSGNILTIFGLVLLLGITGARTWSMLGSTGARRRVERILLVCQLVTLLGLVVYTLTTAWGLGLLGVTAEGAARYRGALTAVYAVLILASTVPILMIEFSLAAALRSTWDVRKDAGDDNVELFRVREMAWSGLTIALAMSFVMVTCGVAKERNIQRDVSYFKTSSPGESTKQIVLSSASAITAHLFFPEGNEVNDQVRAYFDALGSSTSKLAVVEHDRMTDGDLAQRYKVAKDGVVVLSRGEGEAEKFYSFEIDTDIDKARRASGKLRNLDREVNALMMKLARDKRKAYMTSGHGELNHPESVPTGTLVPIRRTTVLRKELADLNYEIKDLALMDLAKGVPDDASVVIMIRPTVPLVDPEWQSLEKYLDRGGKLLITLDAIGQQTMGPLEGRLGVRVVPGGRLVDDVNHYMVRGNLSDRRFTGTTQYSAHATTTGLTRAKGTLLIDAAAFEDVPFAGKGEAPKKTVTLRSMDTSWLDFNENLTLDAAGDRAEKKQKWNLGVAVEGPKVGEQDGFRAMLFSDAELFADFEAVNSRVASPVMYSQGLFKDVVRWLGGEESFVGETVNEDDKAIHRTKAQDAKWFLLTTIGAPILVLALGLIGTLTRRRRSGSSTVKKETVTP